MYARVGLRYFTWRTQCRTAFSNKHATSLPGDGEMEYNIKMKFQCRYFYLNINLYKLESTIDVSQFKHHIPSLYLALYTKLWQHFLFQTEAATTSFWFQCFLFFLIWNHFHRKDFVLWNARLGLVVETNDLWQVLVVSVNVTVLHPMWRRLLLLLPV